jgi:superfamily II RNA helicase
MVHALPEASSLVQEFASGQPFPLDTFQIEAMEALVAGESVLVAAPTGSGKTLVAEFAVFLALKAGRRCIYTTPLKALSNQKYRDLHEALPGKVGLVTGDVVIAPEAPILIMTTEILRNQLQMDPEQVADVAHVILDEAHYLGSEGRGTVWEETIVFLGQDTAVTALSATIPNADELATWVSAVHRPMRVVSHAERPVPLRPWVAAPALKQLFGPGNRLAVKRFGNADGWVEPPPALEVVRELKNRDMLPGIVFVFSRLGCEDEARKLLQSDLELTTPEERERIQAMIDEAIRQTPGMLESAATRAWLQRLPEGVAPHHAGLLPPLKFLIERCFQQALIKVVFATETLAAGINMPARTVVLTSLFKRTDNGHRLVTVAEFQQMMGRAGRRGMDEVGHGIVICSHRFGPEEVARLFTNASEPLRSRFALNFNMVANLTNRYEPAQARRIVEQSFAQFQSSGIIAGLSHQKIEAEKALVKLDPLCPVVPGQSRPVLLEGMRVQRAVRESLRKRLTALETDRQYIPPQAAVRELARAPRGAWLLVHAPAVGHPTPAILLESQKVKSGDVQFTVVMVPPAHGKPVMMRLGSRHLVQRIEDVAPVSLAGVKWLGEIDRTSFLQERPLPAAQVPWAAWIQAAGLDQLDGLDVQTVPPEIRKAREKLQDVSRVLADYPCQRCKERKPCQERVRERVALEEEVSSAQAQIEQVGARHWRAFVRLVKFLEEFDYLRGRELLARGQALAHVRTSNELVVAEALASDTIGDLSPVQLATFSSSLMAEPVRGRQAFSPMPLDPEVGRRIDRLAREAKRISRALMQRDLDLPVYVVDNYAGLVQAWAEGAAWGQIIERSGIEEGLLVRHIRQVIDLIEQFREVPGMPESFRERAREAAFLLDRDLVKEVF